MIRQHTIRLWLLLCAMAAALVISGCGGGSSSSSSTPSSPDQPSDNDPAQTISGTAAAGAPLSGFVGARDVNDETVDTNINADGSFELDLSGLDAPVLLYASGIAGGNAYQMLSVVFEDELDGTANITPLTDLVVGNAVGQNPQAFFNEPDFDLIRQTAIEEQEEALKTRLKPLLDGLGVDDDFDLRNSPFVADRSGFDAALDVIEVQIDSEANTATITNRVDRSKSISNSFLQPDSESEAIEVDEETLNEGVSTLQAAGTLVTAAADALDNNDRDTLETLLAGDFLNNGESGTEWLDRLLGTEDAGELADDLRDWSLDSVDNGTVNLNVGSPNGPWRAVDDNGELKLQGNQLQFLAYAEATHVVENGAEPPVVQEIATSLLALNPVAALGTVDTSSVTVDGPQDTPFNATLEQVNDQFGTFFVIAQNDLDQIQTGDEYTFTWTGDSIAESTYTVRRGEPRLSEGAPEITSSFADLGGNEYSFEWTLPPGYESVSVRNNFTGQTMGGQGGGFTGNPLANEARSFTGELPDGFSPRTDDELRLIARDPYGVFVAARLVNPFADQVPPPSDANALTGSYILRNTDRADDAPYVHFTFLDSGHYIHLELGDDFRPDPDPNGSTGMEVGTYTWNNETGDFTFDDVLIDQNGEWGASDMGAEETPLNVQANADGFVLSFATGDSMQFDRVPANSDTGGIAGTWAAQDPMDEGSILVVTLLDDGFYFVGDSYPASGDETPGLEFGTWSWDSDSLVLQNEAEYDQNGDGPITSPDTSYFSTVVDGELVLDSDGITALSEIRGGNPVGDGDQPVDYESPGSGSGGDGGSAEFAFSGDYHYIRSASGIEGERPDGPGSVYMASYNYPGTVIVDNGDGTGAISYDDWCAGDVLIDAGINQPPVFDSVAFCFGASGSLSDLTFTENGATLVLPAEEITYDGGGQEQLGQSDIDLLAMDDASSLLLGFGKRTFGYETDSGPTSGLDTSVHVLGEKGSGMAPGDLEGDWGWVSFQLSDVSDNPDAIEYNALALSVKVDSEGSATLLDEEYLAIIQSGNTSNLFVAPESSSSQVDEVLGNLTLTDDGELGLFDGEFSGFLSADQQALFLATPSPTATDVPNDLGNNEWVAGIRRGATPLQESDLIGKEYARFGQFYWVGGGFFEVDYSRPGSTLTFPVDSNIAEYRREVDFTYTGFEVNSPVVTGESSNTVGYDFEYEVDPDGLLRMTANISSEEYTDDVTELGWANADASVILIANQYLRTPSDGTDATGGVGISYLICTNCD